VLFLAADDRLNYEGVLRIVDRAKAEADGLRIGLVTRADAGS
jgi:biopolymer transport protein ExbD